MASILYYGGRYYLRAEEPERSGYTREELAALAADIRHLLADQCSVPGCRNGLDNALGYKTRSKGLRLCDEHGKAHEAAISPPEDDYVRKCQAHQAACEAEVLRLEAEWLKSVGMETGQ